MTLATTMGKKFALEALAIRRKLAGSPISLGCKGCNAAIIVPECYILGWCTEGVKGE